MAAGLSWRHHFSWRGAMKLFSLLLFFCLPLLGLAADDPVVGHVQTLQGNAWIERAGSRLTLAVGSEVRRGDSVRTGKPGALGLVLLDNTTVSLGSASTLRLADYVYDPAGGNFALVLHFLKGSFAYLSGMIGKLAPGSIRLQLPDATIAVRGTRLLVEVGE